MMDEKKNKREKRIVLTREASGRLSESGRPSSFVIEREDLWRANTPNYGFSSPNRILNTVLAWWWATIPTLGAISPTPGRAAVF
jgi:hypothetical protein